MVRFDTSRAATRLLFFFMLAVAACDSDEDTTPPEEGGGGATTNSSPASTAQGTTAMSSSTGNLKCQPGEQQACYTGPSATEGVGACQAGTKTCASDGSGFGPCEGEVLPTTDACDTAADENCDGQTPPCPVAFQKHFTTIGGGSDVAIDGDGNIVMVGSFTGMFDFGGGVLSGTSDALVVKYTPEGTHIWSKDFGEDVQPQGAGVVAVHPSGDIAMVGTNGGTIDFGGGPLIAGDFADAWVAKLDGDGNHIFSKHLAGTAAESVQGVAIDAAGDVVVVGSLTGTMDFGGAFLTSDGSDLLVVKFDSLGNHVWSQVHGGASSPFAYDVAIDALGDIYITGSLDATVDFGGGPLTAEFGDAFILKLAPNGDHIWSVASSGAGEAKGLGIAVDDAGNVGVTGEFDESVNLGGSTLQSQGLADVFVAKFDTDGNHMWSKGFGDSLPQSIGPIAFDLSGNLLVTGAHKGAINLGGGALQSAGDYDGYIGSLDPAGNHLWSLRFGTANMDFARSVTTTIAGQAVLVGTLGQGTVDFGGGPLVTSDFNSGFLVVLNPP